MSALYQKKKKKKKKKLTVYLLLRSYPLVVLVGWFAILLFPKYHSILVGAGFDDTVQESSMLSSTFPALSVVPMLTVGFWTE